MLITVTEWAANEGITPQAARKRIRVHGIPRHQGKIDPEEAQRIFSAGLDVRQQERSTALKRQERDVVEASAQKKPGRPEIQTARDAVKLRFDQLRLRKLQGELVESATINGYVAGCIIRARDIMLRIGPELRDRLAQETDPVKIDELITGEIKRGLAELSEFRP